jgi:iron complex outermembrane recepter protein
VAEDVEQGGPATGEMGEVVVTVDRRRKNLQDYSGTASAFSESQLSAIGISNVTALSQVVPGVQIATNEQGSTTIYIRGVGSDNTTELGDPAVAVHVDNVYLPRFRGMNSAWLDVQRVEINSGPQGTVRGRNATGGSINIISNPAVYGEQKAMAEITMGNFRQRSFQGMLNIPFGDSFALRFAASSTSIDETWTNDGPIRDLPGAQDTNNYAMKGQLRFKPVSRLDITLAGDYNLERGTGWNGANMINLITNQSNAGTPLDALDDFLRPIDPNSVDNPRKVFRRGRYPENSTEHMGARLNVNYDAGPVAIELLASYRYLDYNQHSGSTVGFFVPDQQGDTADTSRLAQQQYDNWSFASQQNNDSKSWVGELRFASPDSQTVVWSVGAFGFHEDQGAFLGQITGDPGGFNEFNMPSTIGWSYAGYGDVTINITDDFRVLAGLRYSVEHKDRLGGLWMIGNGLPTGGLALCAQQDNQGNCTNVGIANDGIGRFGTEGFEFKGLDRKNYNVPPAGATAEEKVNFFLDGVKSFGARDETAIALCNDPVPETTITTAQGAVINNPGRLIQDENGNFRCANGVRSSVMANFTNPVPQNGKRDDKYPDFRLGVEYDLRKDNLLYATLSSGHKAGGFNDSIPNPDMPGGFLTPDYGTEQVYALELGSKNLLADRKLRLNASAFAYRYSGLQFQTILTVGTAPPLDALTGRPAIDPATGLAYPDPRGGTAARQNAEDAAMMYGLDVDAVYALPAGLEVDLHALFQDARFPDHTYVNDGRLGLNALPAQVDIGGNWLPRVSPYTFNYSLSQLIFTTVGNFDWIIQGQTRGPHYFTPFNGNGHRFAERGPGWGVNPITGDAQPIEADDPNDPNDMGNAAYTVVARNLERLDDKVSTYSVFNLGFGWRRPDGMLSVRGFVNNVFDTVYANNILSTSGNNIRFYNDPRMFGVRMRLDF